MPFADADDGRAVQTAGQRVAKRRRRVKDTLVAEAGGVCVDCGGRFPPYMYDFDHRDPGQKERGLSAGGLTIGIDRLRLEAAKCDLVCANCHRQRTHEQRCSGCVHCFDSPNWQEMNFLPS